MSEKTRLDVALVREGFAESREKAQALIMSGVVFVDGRRAGKASQAVLPSDALEVRGAAHPYVSRGGLKLERALAAFGVDASGAVCMDIGASTGGFTDVLLRAGARRVYAIDVGYGQLDWRLRGDPRVTVMERTNARYLTPQEFDERPSLCVIDVSFISVKLLLPPITAILGDGGRIVALVKPQFEAGRAQVGKKGVVRDIGVHQAVLADIVAFAHRSGLTVRGADFSPITGPNGNIEFLLDISVQPCSHLSIGDETIVEIVRKAHKTLSIGCIKMQL